MPVLWAQTTQVRRTERVKGQVLIIWEIDTVSPSKNHIFGVAADFAECCEC